ncbi:PTS system, glucose subfamily, IIA component [Anaerocolumna jejuensis DSM 15929]|uniref:PTS system, glucose subfamily, IIA component n=1 Tax=Anaerocolumna jejuensis DSM 15929 TaxID=1121322 RepID=A0A1M6XSK0_9FIRM|nr:PTS glucose transporter subunit IIA [Anaerocolumna jejuensis]SHL08977.1 PTS system, glucose subfamily, IIA component [Anaerocolumna jejuensis DSM 15929]
MNLFKNLQKNSNDKDMKIDTEKFCVYAPMEGVMIELADFPDDVFAQGILGKGVGILPAVGEVRAPFDGIVYNIFDTLHAISLISNDGLEIIIHVGVDTVELKGKGFIKRTQNGAHVKAGELLMEFNIKQIEKAGYKAATAVCVTNSDEYREFNFEEYGHVYVGQKIFHVDK